MWYIITVYFCQQCKPPLLPRIECNYENLMWVLGLLISLSLTFSFSLSGGGGAHDVIHVRYGSNLFSFLYLLSQLLASDISVYTSFFICLSISYEQYNHVTVSVTGLKQMRKSWIKRTEPESGIFPKNQDVLSLPRTSLFTTWQWGLSRTPWGHLYW